MLRIAGAIRKRKPRQNTQRVRRGDGASRHAVLAYRERKIVFVRALAEIDQTTLGCLVDFLLQQSRAGFLAIFCNIKPSKSPSGAARRDFISILLSQNG
jgi:hypothetical protein